MTLNKTFENPSQPSDVITYGKAFVVLPSNNGECFVAGECVVELVDGNAIATYKTKKDDKESIA